MSFLLNCTDPRLQSPYEFHSMLAGSGGSLSGSANWTANYDLIESDQLSETWPAIFDTFINIDALAPPSRSSDLPYGLNEWTKLAGLIDGLIRYLEQAPIPIRFVNAFFENAYKNNPFIHKASFNVNTTSSHLLLAILLLGSTGISPEDASAAEGFYDAVEYSVFEGPGFRRLLFEEKAPRPSAADIELFQASVLLIGLQGSRPQLEAKGQVRILRLPAIVSVVRLLNLTRVRNDTALDGERTNLDGYVQREILVRVMVWIYLVDSYRVVFYRSPPQFRIFEAHFGLAKQDAVFDAVDLAEISRTMPNSTRQASGLTLRSVVQYLMDDKPARLEELQQQINTLFAHFLILCALHCVLFDLQALAHCATTTEVLIPIERALDRWKFLWDLFHARPEKPGMTPSGFMAHGLEFWWLAKMLVKQPRIFGMKEEAATGSTDTFHDIILKIPYTD